eukprot:NODE_1908_length_1037_cov_142.568826_g1417_i1.p1 GENE.NODE_1908_length_1037_cov_142.568826_g1417_i1~~NODE_1908_length_1037_cov_142.568826_g1417_i1.p1  ORF type:complete len:209 (+),score=37.64 NODE_1908_length_1037_cov_142.568826_g1417_i1:312-938(+)
MDHMACHLADTTSANESRMRDLQATNDFLQCEVEASAATKGRLEALLNIAKSDVDTLQSKVASYSSQCKQLQQQSDARRAEAEERAEQVAQLEASTARRQEEVDTLARSLREMETIFKSRLSLVTDVYKTHKKYDTCERRLKTLSQSLDLRDFVDMFSQAFAESKGLIATHFTDAELAHLGSSRHFFPSSRSCSPRPPGNSPKSSRHM